MFSKGMRCLIRDCPEVPTVAGALAEIIDVPCVSGEVYSSYPVWARILTGVNAGMVLGLDQDEIEALPFSPPEQG